jgi:hypothetical protein
MTLPESYNIQAGNTSRNDDPLNLWKGKRLTGTEQRIEARLNRLRHNPAAKTDLQDRVACLLTAKADEAAEQAALQLFASERREQKASEAHAGRGTACSPVWLKAATACCQPTCTR